MTTLREALDAYCARQKRDAADPGSSISQARIAAHALAPGFWMDKPVDCFTPDQIQQCTKRWYEDGLSPATINKRLNCLSAMGVNVQGQRAKPRRALKWWLTPSEQARAFDYLAGTPSAPFSLADFIEWTTLTGLRIEESLRLTWGDIQLEPHGLDTVTGSMTVPGLKTASSQATLPLGPKAATVLAYIRWRIARAHVHPGLQDRVFPISYDRLEAQWSALRTAMGWSSPTCTLKSLRRSAARYLHVELGMPLDMVRHYLRHEDIETTLGYLRLTGGYGTEEMRRFLK